MSDINWQVALDEFGEGVDFAPADEEAIASAEARLGTSLPESYRSFLLTADGWPALGPDGNRLLSATEIIWFRDHPDFTRWRNLLKGELIPVADEDYLYYEEDQDSFNYRPEYLDDALLISDVLEGCYLLNPKITTMGAEEWEAWHLASWYPGAVRYPSFGELALETLEEDAEEIDADLTDVDEEE